MQANLHQWSVNDPERCFDDLFNLVHDPSFLVVAWSRVRENKGGRTAGVDGIAPRSIKAPEAFLLALREDLKARRFTPSRVREKVIPKAPGKVRRLGIPTAADRVVQASLKLVLEPIFEADFNPSSYGFRPNRRAQDAIADIDYFGAACRGYGWVFEADIKACFDEIDHAALMDRVRLRVGDRRVLRLIRAFLRAGILTEEGQDRTTITGTPQGGVLSPLLANIALSALDEHFARKWAALGPAWTRAKLRRAGIPAMRIVRYADDFVVMVNGTQADAEALRGDVTEVLASAGLRLSEEKTKVAHIEEGFDFLGWHIRRRHRRGQGGRTAVYTYPSKKALASVMSKVRSLTARTKHRTLDELIRSVNRLQQGWCNYFRHGVSSRTFSYLDHFTWWRILGWLRKRHGALNKSNLVRRHLPRWKIDGGRVELFRPQHVAITRYRYRGARIPTPWRAT
jgi:RNA-directed DNA polymerase